MIFDRMNTFVYMKQWPQVNSTLFALAKAAAAVMLLYSLEFNIFINNCFYSSCSAEQWKLISGEYFVLVSDDSVLKKILRALEILKTEYLTNRIIIETQNLGATNSCPDVSLHLFWILCMLKIAKVRNHRSICLRGSFDWSVGRSVELGDKKH